MFVPANFDESYRAQTAVIYEHDGEPSVSIRVKVMQSRYTPWRRLGGEEI
jgi:hypothetical protein